MTKIKLSIPEPCNEDWNEMTTTEKGKFCGSCQTDVIDFSKMTKVEIKQYFINQIGKNTCGRFETRQFTEFNREGVETKRINSKPWWIAAATFFMFANQSFSQGKPRVEKQPKIEISKAPVAMEAPKQNNVDPGDPVTNDSLVYISGQVLDAEGEPLFAATVKLTDTNLGCMTDFDGNFKLLVPKKLQDSLKVQISFVGYRRIEHSVKEFNKSKNIGVIQFEEEYLHMLGGAVMVGEIVVEKPTVKVRAKNILLRMFR